MKTCPNCQAPISDSAVFCEKCGTHLVQTDYIGKTCPYCQYIIKPGEGISTCHRCHIAHHSECWEANGKQCTTFGCAEASSPSVSTGYVIVPQMPAEVQVNSTPLSDVDQTVDQEKKQYKHFPNVALEMTRVKISTFILWSVVAAACSFILTRIPDWNNFADFTVTNVAFAASGTLAVFINLPISCVITYFLGYKDMLIKTALCCMAVSFIQALIALTICQLFGNYLFCIVLYGPALGLCLGLPFGDKTVAKRLTIAGFIAGVLAIGTMLLLGSLLNSYESDIATLMGNSPDIDQLFSMIFSVIHFISLVVIIGSLPLAYRFSLKYIFK